MPEINFVLDLIYFLLYAQFYNIQINTRLSSAQGHLIL